MMVDWCFLFPPLLRPSLTEIWQVLFKERTCTAILLIWVMTGLVGDPQLISVPCCHHPTGAEKLSRDRCSNIKPVSEFWSDWLYRACTDLDTWGYSVLKLGVEEIPVLVFSLAFFVFWIFYQIHRHSPTCLFSLAVAAVRTHPAPCLCFTDYVRFLCFWELRCLDSHVYWADVSFPSSSYFLN